MMLKLVLVSILLQTAPEAEFWVDDDPFLKFIWEPAYDEEGNPWEHSYGVWVSVNGGEYVKIAEVETETYTIQAESGKVYRMKVAAVYGDWQGEYSPESDPVVCAMPRMPAPRMILQ